MKRIIWLPTLRCDYRCPYCYMIKLPRDYPERPVENWLDVLNKRQSLWIDISGGEPFIYPEFVNLVKQIPKRHTVSLTTNLSRPAELIKLKGRLHSLTLSFHPSHALFSSFVTNAELIASTFSNITVNIVAYPEYLTNLRRWLKVFEDKKLRVHIEPYISHERPYTEEERKFVAKLSHDRVLGWQETSKPRICDAGIVSEYWTPNGDIFTCSTAFRIHNFIKPLPNNLMGNLFKGTYIPKTKPFLCDLPCVMGCDQDTRKDIWGVLRNPRSTWAKIKTKFPLRRGF